MSPASKRRKEIMEPSALHVSGAKPDGPKIKIRGTRPPKDGEPLDYRPIVGRDGLRAADGRTFPTPRSRAMLSLLGPRGRLCDSPSRRDLLTAGSLPLLGLALPSVLRLESRAKADASAKP